MNTMPSGNEIQVVSSKHTLAYEYFREDAAAANPIAS